ncbi:MAG TPA: hypothetical protein VF424_00990 [Vicinamibacterales bacterium]
MSARHAVTVIGVIAYSFAIYALLPGIVVAVNDDFAYFRSVLQTLEHARPWTNDFLEPWAAGQSVLSALIFKATGSFHLATLGIQTLAAGAAVAGVVALLRAGLGPVRCLLVAVLLLSCPTVLAKSLEFTSVVLYLPCLLWAIWAAERRRWAAFFLIWAFAFSNRQSAIAWLALPALDALSRWRIPGSRPIDIARPAAVLVLSGVMFVMLSGFMNKTQSQTLLTDHLLERVEITKVVHYALIGWAMMLVSIGLGSAAIGLGEPNAARPRHLARRTIVTAIVGSVVVAVLVFRNWMKFEHSGTLTVGAGYLTILFLLAAVGWAALRVSVRWPLIAAAAASVVLASLRVPVSDYYYIDAAILAFFSVVPVRTGAPAPAVWRTRAVAAAFAGAIAFVHVRSAIELKDFWDRAVATTLLAEQSLRSGQIGPADLSFAEFGFQGWHLYPYFAENEGRNDPDIGGFVRYTQPGSVTVISEPFTGQAELPARAGRDGDPSVIRSVVVSSRWFWRQRHTLVRPAAFTPGPDLLVIDPARYRAMSFPLSDREWRDLMNGALHPSR